MAEQIPSPEENANALVEAFHSIAQSHESQEATVGEILAPPPNIQVKWNNIILTAEQVYISEYLLAGYRREGKGTIVSGTQAASCPVGAPHTHPINNPYTDDIIYTDTLKAGDIVSVLPIKGGQKYIITDKLIDLIGGDRGGV